MSKGSILIYTSAAGQAAPLPSVTLTVTDAGGSVRARLVTDADGFAEATDLPAPDAAYSLDAANTTVQPYALYRIEAALDGWQPLVLNGVQVFDAQQTVARLNLLPAGAAPASAVSRTGEVETDIVTIPPHTLLGGNGGSGPAPEELLPGSVLNRIVVPKKITVHLGKPSANVRNVTVSFQSYIANVASSEVYPTWDSAPGTRRTFYLKAPPQLYTACAVLRRVNGNALQQGRGLVLRQLPRRSGIAGQLVFDKRLGVAQRPVGLARAGGLAPARRAAAEVPPRPRAGQLHLDSADTTPDKPGQRVACCRCLSAMRRQPRLHRCKIRPADERHVGAGYDDPILPRQADDPAGLVIQLAHAALLQIARVGLRGQNAPHRCLAPQRRGRGVRLASTDRAVGGRRRHALRVEGLGDPAHANICRTTCAAGSSGSRRL